MRVAGRLAAEILEIIEPYVVPGVSTGELDRICDDYITQNSKRSLPAWGITAIRNPFVSL